MFNWLVGYELSNEGLSCHLFGVSPLVYHARVCTGW